MRVLVCEDETIIRLDLCQLLESAGMRVAGEARNGLEAVRLAETLQPDVVLMDVRMPELDGVEAARRILAERQVPIVMVTAFAERDIVDGNLTGRDGHRGPQRLAPECAHRDDIGSGGQLANSKGAPLIGGRLRTVRLPGWQMPIELGAELVHGRPAPTLALGGGAIELVNVPERRVRVGTNLEPMVGTWRRLASAPTDQCEGGGADGEASYETATREGGAEIGIHAEDEF